MSGAESGLSQFSIPCTKNQRSVASLFEYSLCLSTSDRNRRDCDCCGGLGCGPTPGIAGCEGAGAGVEVGVVGRAMVLPDSVELDVRARFAAAAVVEVAALRFCLREGAFDAAGTFVLTVADVISPKVPENVRGG